MFKKHPKGLIVAFFANMGERFGFYTMMAILVLFLQAKYGLTEKSAGSIYSWFYFGIYALALVGGILADATKRYKLVILAGIIIMFVGYLALAIPGLSLTMTVLFLFTIAFGNGLFKGNLQAVVGQMYDDPKYEKLRDSAFMLFYMGINVGAFFAPFAATGIRNWALKVNGFLHDGSLPAMCHQFKNGTLGDLTEFQELANKVSLKGPVTDLAGFADTYLDFFARGYNYAFGIAAGAMVISLLVYIVFNRMLPDKAKAAKEAKADPNKKEVRMSWAEEKQRLISLSLVFLVVIFFWMSFHQNGLTLTLFARDYTVKAVGAFTNIFFNLESMLAFIGAIAGVVLLLNTKVKATGKLVGGIMLIGFGYLTYYFYSGYGSGNPIEPEIFQSFNPLFIVSLTFLVVGFFSWLNKRGMEPSTPKKIGIGMVIAAVGFVIVLVGSLNLISPHDLKYLDEAGNVKFNPVPDTSRVTPYWLISSYLVLTIAELFLSPIGLSFVSKVAPPRFQGFMQGGWLLATAIGNKLLFVGSYFWGILDLWQLWAIFIVCCILSALFIFSILKRLERVTGSA
ncbi:MAG: peptide MFS transporter [Bacteroidales bacterium]|nr:peptide MFS transporter [Bacteroidales bacterium]